MIVFSGSGPEQLTIEGTNRRPLPSRGSPIRRRAGMAIDITGIGAAGTSTSFTFNSGTETLTVVGTTGTTW